MSMALSTGIRRVAAQLTPSATTDGELLSRFQALRDEAAFTVLVRRHGPMVLGVCRRVLGNAADADDAFQAAFVVLVRKASTLTARPCVGPFLYTAALHASLKVRTMASRRKAKETRASRSEPLMESAGIDEWARVLDEELAKLPEKYRDPVVLCELEGVSRREAATRLGIPEGTISSRLATAHRMLEKRLKMRGFATVVCAALFGSQAFARTISVSDSLLTSAAHAATSGAPAGINRLATEVTKMFLLSKLKVGAIVLASMGLLLGLGAWITQIGTAAEEQVKTAAPVPMKEKVDDADAKRILGRWISKKWSMDPPVEGILLPPTTIWTFGEKSLLEMQTGSPDKISTANCQFQLNSLMKPKDLTFTGEKTQKECIYELNGDKLKVAFYNGSAQKPRPTAFTANLDSLQDTGPLTIIEFERDRDQELIQGLWQAESLEAEGNKAPAEVVEKFQVRFEKDKITFVVDNRTHTFELNPAANPKAMNLIPGDGEAKGKKLESAIYELNGDTLKICIDKEGLAGKRPSEFKTAPKDGLALMVLKRVKAPVEKKKSLPFIDF